MKSAIDHPNDRGPIRELGRSVPDGVVDVDEFKRSLIMGVLIKLV